MEKLRDKAPSADETANEHLRFQLSVLNADKACRRIGILMLSVLFAFFAVLCILFFVTPKKSFSEEENRVLQGFDSISLSSLTDGSFAKRSADVISDQFPARRFFISVESYLSLAFTGSANNVVLVNGNALAEKNIPDEQKLASLEDSVSAIVKLGKRFERDNGIQSSFVAIPLPVTASEKLRSSARYASLGRALRTVPHIETGLDGNGTFYYSTDHHLNADGTYLVYLALCREWDIGDECVYKKECVSDCFYGTTWSRARLQKYPPDRIYAYRYEGDTEYLIKGDTDHRGFYFPEYLEKKDKYSYFLGGNYGRIEICSERGEERPRLLIIKDSYANSLVPLLARHFDITLIDPRYYSGNVLDEAQNADRCLFLFGMSSLMTDVGLVKLSFNASK